MFAHWVNWLSLLTKHSSRHCNGERGGGSLFLDYSLNSRGPPPFKKIIISSERFLDIEN